MNGRLTLVVREIGVDQDESVTPRNQPDGSNRISQGSPTEARKKNTLGQSWRL